MHNAAFAALGLDWVYVPFAVGARDVGRAVAGIRALGLAGANVTVPHKQAVLAHLDVVHPLAQRVGAVNTIVNRGGVLHGDNTDVYGFAQLLRGARARLRRRPVVVIGAGGSSRAVLAALSASGATPITIVNRTTSRARTVARRFPELALRVAPLSSLTRQGCLADAAAVINTTSAGLHGAELPIAYEASPAECLFIDLLYGGDTAFLRGARRARRRASDGAEMLLHQGARAFAMWTGRRPPLNVMRRALNGKNRA